MISASIVMWRDPILRQISPPSVVGYLVRKVSLPPSNLSISAASSTLSCFRSIQNTLGTSKRNRNRRPIIFPLKILFVEDETPWIPFWMTSWVSTSGSSIGLTPTQSWTTEAPMHPQTEVQKANIPFSSQSIGSCSSRNVYAFQKRDFGDWLAGRVICIGSVTLFWFLQWNTTNDGVAGIVGESWDDFALNGSWRWRNVPI